MGIEIKVPRLGWSMEEGTFVEWLKRDGERVEPGQPLFALEGDKAIQEVESIGSGILRISPTGPANGSTVKVGVTLAYLLERDEADPFEGQTPLESQTALNQQELSPAADSERSPRSPTSSPQLGQTQGTRKEVGERIVRHAVSAQERKSRDLAPGRRQTISPRAARVARELRVDWTGLRGTGGGGRIRERDVRARAAERASEMPSAAATHSSRRTTAAGSAPKAMTPGLQFAHGAVLTTTVDATQLVALRARFKAATKSAGDPIPGYTAIVAKLVGRALVEHPTVNRQWAADQLVSADGIHIALVVDAPNGLVAPVLRDVLKLGLREIAARYGDLKDRALAAQLKPDELGGSAFAIANMGSFGVDTFTPPLAAPHSAVLGLGRIERQPRLMGDQIVPRDVLALALVFDHRIVGPAAAARFLATLRGAIENPGPWLVF